MSCGKKTINSLKISLAAFLKLPNCLKSSAKISPHCNIPEGTVLIQPVLLTNIRNVPNNIAIFVLTANGPTQVTKVKIDPREFGELLTQYRQQLANPLEDSQEFDDNQKQLYDYLIRPVEAQIQTASPKQLAIIATGKLRYIPFETLYDRETKQYPIEKYPISYRTRISAREKQPVIRPRPGDS